MSIPLRVQQHQRIPPGIAHDYTTPDRDVERPGSDGASSRREAHRRLISGIDEQVCLELRPLSLNHDFRVRLRHSQPGR